MTFSTSFKTPKTAIGTAYMESYPCASEEPAPESARMRPRTLKKRMDLPRQRWSDRYLAYRLVSRYTNLNYSAEERELARLESQQLQERFKFDLAMYAAHAHLSPCDRQLYPNPTLFGDDVLRLIKLVVVGRGRLNYRRLTQLFMERFKAVNYQTFKEALVNFLGFGDRTGDWTDLLRQQLSQDFNNLYPEKNGVLVDEALIFRTCNRAIELLTTQDGKSPSAIFTAKIACRMPLFMTITLLKLILISPKSRCHLELAIAKLIGYFEHFPVHECRSVIQFFEMFQIVVSIYAEDVEYSLVHINSSAVDRPQDNEIMNLDSYRVFARLKKEGLHAVKSVSQG